MSRVRLVPIALIVIVTLAVLFGVWRLYLQFSLMKPVVTSIRSVTGVMTAKAVSENPPIVDVTLKPQSDLQTTYQAIEQTLNDASSSITVHIASSHEQSMARTVELVMDPAFYEAVDHGDFSTMESVSAKNAKAVGATVHISMDDHMIYIQIAKDHQYYYDMIPYTLH